jgi:hypothetical protein
VVNAMPKPLYPRKRDKLPIVQGAGWFLGPVWTDVEPVVCRVRYSGHLTTRSDCISGPPFSYSVPNSDRRRSVASVATGKVDLQ